MINDAEGESIPIRDYALAYAAQGYKIIPLYTTIPDRPPEQACTCGKMHKDGKSVGKHPYLAHAPHGVNSATSDPAVIATWPEDGYNLGLAMTDTMIAIDIDDSDVAAAMLDPDFGLRDRGIVARTRRGLHFIVPVFVPTTSSVLKHADGRPIGEVRAAGEYIVLPPSRHLTGYYYWIGPGLDQLQAQPPYPGTGYEYAAALLADVGIVPASLSTLTATGLPDGDVIPTVTGDEDLPFKIRQGSILRQMLDGVRPITDRSDALFFMACEFYRQAASKHVVVDPLLVAGIIRRADYAHYHKFSDRNDQDRRYYECAVRAQADVNATQLSLPEAQPMASTDPEQLAVTEQSDIFTDAPVTEHGASDYEYRLGDGLYYLGSKKAERICNFEALITECRVIYHGEETTAGAAPDQEWEITMTKPGQEPVVVVVSSAQYNDPPTLIRRLRSVLSPEWVIHDRVAGWFLSALQYRSGTVPTRMVYAASGWLPDRDAFLIPGLPGAIIPDGWDLDVVYEPAGADRSGLTIVATPRVVAEGASIDDTLRILQASAPAHILVPLLSQYTAAPLVSLGYKDAAWLHLFGPTQVFKTTLAEALLSMYGYTPNRRARGVVSFAADTDGTIRRWLHLYRDMPCIIDDFKTGSRADVQIVNLIQGYGDNRGRGRLTREGSYRSADDPRGLAISTGEDVWESQRSAIARTMLVDMEPGDVTRDGIQAIQDIASSGALAALGVAWIRWLTKRGKVVLTAYLIDEVRKNTEKVSQFAGVDAVRITHQTTSMFTVSRLFGEFVRETAGAAAASEYRRWASEGWMQIFRGAKEQARESLTMSPLSQMIDMMRDAVDGGRAYFRYRGPSGPSLGNPGTRCIGYVTEDAIYFRKSMTYYWFLEECAHARRDAGFSWNQVMREVRDKYASESTPMRTPDGELVRLVSIPRYLIGALDDAVATTESV